MIAIMNSQKKNWKQENITLLIPYMRVANSLIHKQALMEILIGHFKIFQNDRYIMKPLTAVVNEAKEYLKYSDDFFGWFSDKFEKKEGSTTTFKSPWNKFSVSGYYNNMTKNEK